MPLVLASPYYKKLSIVEALYAVYDKASAHSSASVSDDGLTATTSFTGGMGVRSSVGVAVGRYYFEFKIDAAYNTVIGVGIEGSHLTAGNPPNGLSYVNNRLYIGTTAQPLRVSIVTGDIIGVALNRDTNVTVFYINGVLIAQGSIPSLAAGAKVYAYVRDNVGGASTTVTANFGQKPFRYAVPNGYIPGLPRKVYATLRSELKQTGDSILGDLRIQTGEAATSGARANLGKSSGKWYWEVTLIEGSHAMIGVAAAGDYALASPWASTNSAYFYSNANKSNYLFDKSAYSVKNSNGLAVGDVVGIALNMDAKIVEFTVNGVFFGSCSLPSTTLYPTLLDGSPNNGTLDAPTYAVMDANFGQNQFKYPVPAGFNSGIYD